MCVCVGGGEVLFETSVPCREVVPISEVLLSEVPLGKKGHLPCPTGIIFPNVVPNENSECLKYQFSIPPFPGCQVLYPGRNTTVSDFHCQLQGMLLVVVECR